MHFIQDNIVQYLSLIFSFPILTISSVAIPNLNGSPIHLSRLLQGLNQFNNSTIVAVVRVLTIQKPCDDGCKISTPDGKRKTRSITVKKKNFYTI